MLLRLLLHRRLRRQIRFLIVFPVSVEAKVRQYAVRARVEESGEVRTWLGSAAERLVTA